MVGSGVERVGAKPFPLVTVTVFGITAVASVIAEFDTTLLDQWQRSPAGLHGDWWRTLTALFVQDGGIIGMASNLLFLLIVGTAAERILSPAGWLLQYFSIGLATELIAYLWQPTGAGNSIAICGLAGAVMVAYSRNDRRVPTVAAQAVTIWTGGVAGTAFPTLSAVWIIAGFVGAAAIGILDKRGTDVRFPSMVTVGAVAVILTGSANIHGIALLLGYVLAFATRSSQRKPHLRIIRE